MKILETKLSSNNQEINNLKYQIKNYEDQIQILKTKNENLNNVSFLLSKKYTKTISKIFCFRITNVKIHLTSE